MQVGWHKFGPNYGPLEIEAPEDVVPDAAITDTISLNEGQRAAFALIEDWLSAPKASREPRFALAGPAGTGKSVIIQRLAPLLHQGFYAATTGKAASRLHQLGLPANTLHRLLYGPPTVDEDTGAISFHSIRRPPYGSTIVIDEASMITPQVEKDLQRWVDEFGARILFVGDGFQLPPILSREEIKNGVSEDYTIFAELEGAALTQVMRSGNAVLEAATMLRTTRKLPTQSKNGYTFSVADDAIEAAVQAYLKHPDDHGLITWTNRTRMLTNQIIRSRLGIMGEIPVPGEPILVRKNSGHVLNGEVVTIRTITQGEDVGPIPTWRIETEDGRTVLAHGYGWTGDAPFIQDKHAWREYRRVIENRVRAWQWDPESMNDEPPEPVPVTYGYALTAHTAQGSEYERVTVFMPQMDAASAHFRKPTKLPDGTAMPFGIRWYYTAATRAKTHLSVIVGR